MIKKYNVIVNGKSYSVEVEEQDSGYAAPSSQVVAPPSQVAAAPTVVEETSKQAAPAAPVVAAEKTGKYEITSPMPGTILKHLVSPGDKVEKNQPIMVLEAMKMENEIVAQEAGVVKTINVLEGSTVKTGDVLATID